jgi:integrase
MPRTGRPWWRAGKRAYYAWVRGRQTRLSADRAEAYRIWHELSASPPGVDVAALVGAYLDACAGLAPATLRTKRAILGRLSGEVTDLTPGGVLAWLDSRPSWGRSRRWTAAGQVKAMARWAVKEGRLPAYPLAGLSVPGPLSRGESALVTAEQHAALLGRADADMRDALALLHATGCRPGELCALTAAHVSPCGAFALLRAHKTAGKTGRPRVVVLGPAAAVVARRRAGAGAGPLFTWRGRPLTPARLSDWVRWHRRRLGLPPVIPYGYRHTLATDALAGGVPEAVVASLLGHAGTAVLHRHYSHLTARLDALQAGLARVRK